MLHTSCQCIVPLVVLDRASDMYLCTINAQTFVSYAVYIHVAIVG